jgi:hypothetical protein
MLSEANDRASLPGGVKERSLDYHVHSGSATRPLFLLAIKRSKRQFDRTSLHTAEKLHSPSLPSCHGALHQGPLYLFYSLPWQLVSVYVRSMPSPVCLLRSFSFHLLMHLSYYYLSGKNQF